MNVELLEVMGSDLTIVNAARVSFAAESHEFSGRDKKLIKYLARHNHWTPFAHVQLQFRIKAPVFVARQLVKHQIGMVWNEVSRRYVDSYPQFHNPEAWRMRADDKKQGSSDEVFTGRIAERFDERYKDLMLQAAAVFDNMIATGVAPEQARMVLPQAMMTEWIWTGSLVAFARVVKLRAASDAQLECQWVANMIDQEIKQREELKHSWSALCQ